MKFLLILLLIVLFIFVFYVIYKHFSTKKDILTRFKDGNVIVSGRKGYGKDILFQSVINWRKDKYYSNIDYGGDYNHISPKDIELTPNSYENFINNNVVNVKKIDELEKKDIYFSDGGVIFPSQADSYLHKTYKSLPLFFALNRHLYDNGMHINTQRLDRVWKALREQADSYILIRKRRLKIFNIFVIFTTTYDKLDSALQELSPLNSRLFNKYSKAEVDLYNAKHGKIRNGFFITSKRRLKYDSRAFHKIIFGYVAPTKKEKKDINAELIYDGKEE